MPWKISKESFTNSQILQAKLVIITGPPTCNGAKLVKVSGVCRRLSSSSVTLHGGAYAT